MVIKKILVGKASAVYDFTAKNIYKLIRVGNIRRVDIKYPKNYREYANFTPEDQT